MPTTRVTRVLSISLHQYPMRSDEVGRGALGPEDDEVEGLGPPGVPNVGCGGEVGSQSQKDAFGSGWSILTEKPSNHRVA